MSMVTYIFDVFNFYTLHTATALLYVIIKLHLYRWSNLPLPCEFSDYQLLDVSITYLTSSYHFFVEPPLFFLLQIFFILSFLLTSYMYITYVIKADLSILVFRRLSKKIIFFFNFFFPCVPYFLKHYFLVIYFTSAFLSLSMLNIYMILLDIYISFLNISSTLVWHESCFSLNCSSYGVKWHFAYPFFSHSI